MAQLRVVAFDPSLRNWGYARGILDLSTGKPQIEKIGVINPVFPTGKQVRQNSKDLESALQLSKGAWEVAFDAQAIFVEVPVGSQSARAMASYGICVGILGALKTGCIPMFEVSPTEVKMAAVGIKTATKDQMIDWAVQQHPEANWPFYNQKGEQLLSREKAEHMADAIAAIYAGTGTASFKQLATFLKVA